jgi:sugar O-acyltransferase (sialic acid O-acetyltransferase NeuD family)
MTKVALGLYGAGGFGREVKELIPSIVSRLFPGLNKSDFLLVFIDDNQILFDSGNDQIIPLDKFVKLESYKLYYCITIADCKSRKNIVKRMENYKIDPITLIFNDTHVMNTSTIGIGSIIMPGSKISTSVAIGNHVQVNFNSYIAHDCKLGDFVTISPGVTCCGNTLIGSGTLIGAASVIKQGTQKNPRKIGNECTLGLGSVLLTDIPDSQTYVGNPARKL